MKSLARIIFRFLAKRILRKYHPLVIGVAGSVGKTATKEAIAAGIATAERSVRKTEGSFNAEIGVPATIIRAGRAPGSWWGWLGLLLTGKMLWLGRRAYPRALVLEMGTDHPGDLPALIALAQPTIGVLTSTAPEHLEFFGSEEKVIAEESLIVRTLGDHGTAILNLDDPAAAGIRSHVSGTVISYGWAPGATIRADGLTITRSSAGLPNGMVVKVAVDGSVIPVALPDVLGRHQAHPILAAFAVGRALGDDVLSTAKRLAAYRPPPGRMRLLEGVNNSVLIDDSYNASPAAVIAAIETLDELEVPGQKYVVLGQMSELGAAAARWHDAIGQQLGRRNIQTLITVGPLAKRIGSAALAAGWTADRIFAVDQAESAAAFLRSRLNPGDAVLLKGSRYASRLERAVSLLLAHPERDQMLLVQSR